MNKNIIVLVGMPGSGKTKVGRKLANTMNFRFVDTDQYIEREMEESITTIFESKGELYFRQLESELIQTLLNEKDNLVIATGGGLPCYNQNMDIIVAGSISIYLEVPVPVIAQRIQHSTHRPLLQTFSLDTLESLYAHRKAFYERALIHIPFTNNKPVSAILDRLNEMDL